MAETTEIMTVTELADYFKVSAQLIRREAKNGKLPFAKIGGEMRFDKSEVVKAVFGR